jgi:hypothetical protein
MDRLFEMDTAWQEEWKDMPEFVQEKQKNFATIIVRFSNQKDLDDFSALVNQKLNKKTKSIWYPFKSHWGNGDGKIYKNES